MSEKKRKIWGEKMFYKNKVELVGRIATDIKIKKFEDSVRATFKIAVQRSGGYRDKNGNTLCDFIPCVAWDNQARGVKDYKKNDWVSLEGTWQSRRVTKNGNSFKRNNLCIYYSEPVLRKSEVQV